MTEPTDSPSADARFEALAARYVDEAPALSPASATHLGDHRYDGELDDVSDQARDKRTSFCRNLLDELSAIGPETLSRANQVDAAMLAHRLRSEIWHVEQLREWSWNPMAYTGLAGGCLYGLVAREFAPLAERINHAAERMEQIPRMLEQARANLDASRVPKVHAETAVKQNRGVITLIDTMIRPHAASLGEADRARLERAMETATQAVLDHQTLAGR